MSARLFHLERDTDVSGVSGVGTVAEGVEFSDGTVVLRWTAGDDHSTVVWASIGAVERIHGHSGATRIVWDDEPGTDDLRLKLPSISTPLAEPDPRLWVVGASPSEAQVYSQRAKNLLVGWTVTEAWGRHTLEGMRLAAGDRVLLVGRLLNYPDEVAEARATVRRACAMFGLSSAAILAGTARTYSEFDDRLLELAS